MVPERHNIGDEDNSEDDFLDIDMDPPPKLPTFDQLVEEEEAWPSYKSRFSNFFMLYEYPAAKQALALLVHLSPTPCAKFRDLIYPSSPETQSLT